MHDGAMKSQSAQSPLRESVEAHQDGVEIEADSPKSTMLRTTAICWMYRCQRSGMSDIIAEICMNNSAVPNAG